MSHAGSVVATVGGMVRSRCACPNLKPGQREFIHADPDLSVDRFRALRAEFQRTHGTASEDDITGAVGETRRARRLAR